MEIFYMREPTNHPVWSHPSTCPCSTNSPGNRVATAGESAQPWPDCPLIPFPNARNAFDCAEWGRCVFFERSIPSNIRMKTYRSSTTCWIPSAQDYAQGTIQTNLAYYNTNQYRCPAAQEWYVM